MVHLLPRFGSDRVERVVSALRFRWKLEALRRWEPWARPHPANTRKHHTPDLDAPPHRILLRGPIGWQQKDRGSLGVRGPGRPGLELAENLDLVSMVKRRLLGDRSQRCACVYLCRVRPASRRLIRSSAI